MTDTLISGAASVEITPKDSQFLYGYPHVERHSTGVHDPLMSSALYLSDGQTQVLFVANDIIYVPKSSARRIRDRIAQRTSVPARNVMITATHTHSGPITVRGVSGEADPVVPPADPAYVQYMEEQIVEAATRACQGARPAKLGLAMADATGIGTNRRDPSGPADLNVPVLLVRSADGDENLAMMLVVCMHPTVLHEDSKLVSADFPGMAGQYLRANAVGEDCVVLHHTGPAGNQSPRHVTKANTFEEAVRLGEILGRAVEKVIPEIRFGSDIELACLREEIDLPRKTFPPVEQAQEKLDGAVRRLEHLRQSAAPRQEVRTAECDWFGAEETLTLAKAAVDGRLEAAYEACLPAEIQIIRVGPWSFVGWSGEVFIEYPLAVKAECENTFVISLANGELEGYIVTPQAAAEGGYEASNALFAPESGSRLVEETLEMLGK